MNKNHSSLSVIMMGATGAVGSQTLNNLLEIAEVKSITLLGRRVIKELTSIQVHQHKIDIFNPESYTKFVPGHEVAICTIGVGQPSKTSKEDFIKIDKTAVLDFAKTCRKAGIRHFELLSSVGIDAQSSSFFLRTKGELVEALVDLQFERLSIFQPSMILTPNNRYGMMQGITLAVWPRLNPFLIAGLKKYRGIKVEQLGKAMAMNIMRIQTGVEMLTWEDFQEMI